MAIQHPRILVGLSLLLAIALAIASYYGAFVPGTYERDSASMAAQGMGQDLFDLFFVTPLLLISLLYTLKGNRIALFIFAGTVFYVLYSFFIYAFGVHFNSLFLIYCLVLGSSLYTFLLIIYENSGMELNNWFGEKTPTRAIGIYFISVALLFYLLWLKDTVPSILNNTVPANVLDNDLLVNPVHVLDMAIALPGLVITAVLLFKKQTLGFLFAPVFLIFTVLLSLSLIAMVLALNAKGISEDISIAGIFLILAVISMGLLTMFFRNMKRTRD
jgi:hypothetical protein